MELKDQIDTLLQSWELCGTIKEGLDYLSAHIENKQMLADVQVGLSALQASLPKEMPKAVANQLQNIQRLLRAQNIQAGALPSAAKQMWALFSEGTVKLLFDPVNQAVHIDRSLAKRLFAFCDSLPSETVAVLLINICLTCGASAPTETFDHMMKLFEQYPSMLSGENALHPGYTYAPSAQKTFDRCPVCKKEEGEPYFAAFSYEMANFDHPHLPMKLWMKCGNCKNLYTWKYPQKLLSAPETPLLPNPDRFLETVEDTDAGNLSFWAKKLQKLENYTKGKDLLEIGVGKGELLAVALELGYTVDAVEIVTQAAQKTADLLGIPVWNGDFLNYHPDKTYSLLIMGDVIEHVTDPEQALRSAHRLLKDDGALWLSTPDFESSFSKLRKFKDHMWKEPFHITYFSYSSLKALAEKCGFSVEDHDVSAHYNGSMELILTKKPLDKKA